MSLDSDFSERSSKIRLLLSDVDGVWTTGQIQVHANGEETVAFHVHDGFGLAKLIQSGVEVAVISGRSNPAVAHRARRLGVSEIHLGKMEKADLARDLIAARDLRAEEVAAIGDDIPDLGLFQHAGLCFSPPEATPQVLQAADYVTEAKAGHGALREVCDLLLAARKKNQASS